MSKLLLYITRNSFGEENMFDYQSSEKSDRYKFKAQTVHLELPSKQPIYYFFHQSSNLFSEKNIQIECRNAFFSNFNDSNFFQSEFQLVTGIKLWLRKNEKGMKDLMMKCFKAEDIPTDQYNIQTKEKALPYYVVRSFRHFPLRNGQIVKLGSVEFDLVQVQNNPNLQRYFNSLVSQQIMEIAPLSLQKNFQNKTNSKKAFQCRICRQDYDLEEDRLISICKCQRSIGFVHISCVRDWMQMRASKMKRYKESYSTFYTNLLACEICKEVMPKALKIQNKIFPILPFFDEITPYIALKQVHQEIAQKIYVKIRGDAETTVGRYPSNQFTIENSTISLYHAAFATKNGEIVIKDKESQFGSLVHDSESEIRVTKNMKALQVKETVFAFQLVKKVDA